MKEMQTKSLQPWVGRSFLIQIPTPKPQRDKSMALNEGFPLEITSQTELSGRGQTYSWPCDIID